MFLVRSKRGPGLADLILVSAGKVIFMGEDFVSTTTRERSLSRMLDIADTLLGEAGGPPRWTEDKDSESLADST